MIRPCSAESWQIRQHSTGCCSKSAILGYHFFPFSVWHLRKRPALPLDKPGRSCSWCISSLWAEPEEQRKRTMGQQTILVIGATGTVGAPVARQLREDGHHVRLLVRDPTRAAAQLGSSFDYIQGSVEERETLKQALSGCTA